MVVTNNSFLLFFFDMLLPYAFHLTYLNMALRFTYRNTQIIKHMSNMCLPHGLPHIYYMFNMLLTHVHFTFCYCLNW
jgi:hypothetical protein